MKIYAGTIPIHGDSEEEELVLRSVSAAGKTETITFSQVAVGEVWVAGGQSNMEFHMRYEKHLTEALKVCVNPRVRFFDVPEVSYGGQDEEFDYSRMGIWRKADPENLEYFSAVGYYFERELERVLDVPVGIIGCNWGGTRSCAWMSVESVERAGKPWMQMYEDRIAEMDMDEYWETQHGNPMNHRGDPFADPFEETVLPRTLSTEELTDFFQKMPAGTEEYRECMLPCEIPGSLYEHMLKTVAPYGIRGFLWYQGESDDEPGKQCILMFHFRCGRTDGHSSEGQKGRGGTPCASGKRACIRRNAVVRRARGRAYPAGRQPHRDYISERGRRAEGQGRCDRGAARLSGANVRRREVCL